MWLTDGQSESTDNLLLRIGGRARASNVSTSDVFASIILRTAR